MTTATLRVRPNMVNLLGADAGRESNSSGRAASPKYSSRESAFNEIRKKSSGNRRRPKQLCPLRKFDCSGKRCALRATNGRVDGFHLVAIQPPDHRPCQPSDYGSGNAHVGPTLND